MARLARGAARLAQGGRHAEAVREWERLNRLCPGNPALAAGLGSALLGAGRNQDALAWLSKACTDHPGEATLLRLQAYTFLRLGLRAPGIGALLMALELEPNSTEVHAVLGGALFHDGEANAALPHCRYAFSQDPNLANAATLSCVLIDLGLYEEALAVTSCAGQGGAEALEALVNRSIALQGLGREEEGLEAARAALAARPDSAVARHHLAASLLGRGELTPEAWALYEARSGLAHGRKWSDTERRWTGADVAGRTMLLHAEQGLGDTIQFVRYAPLVAQRGARVVLAVQPSLVRLMQGTPGADQVVPTGETLPAFDLYAPMLSLPGLFGTTLETIPPTLPYALAFPDRAPSEHLRVGLVWAGNQSFVDDRKRSMPPAALAPLAGVEGVVFHSLQFGAATLPFAGMVDAMMGVTDMADTAARIAELDLVIAVDTSVAHLAATLGKPVWLLSRHLGCWRWLQGRDDSPWYPSVRIYRQTGPNDWDSVISRVRDDLTQLAAGRTGARNEAIRQAA